MAPEVLAGHGASPVSDVSRRRAALSPGHGLVSARRTHDGRPPRRASRRSGGRPLVDRRPDLPLAFVQVVERALAADPQQRWPTAGALLEAQGAIDGSTRLRLRFLVNIGVAAWRERSSR